MPRRDRRGAQSPLGRVALALGHPLRIRALSALSLGEGSASTLCRCLDCDSVGDLSYHLRVLADDCGLIERVRSRQVRGAFERFFRLKPGTGFAVERLQVDERGLEEINELLRKAMADVKRVELDSRRRLQLNGAAEVTAVVSAASFQAVD
jgi:DNA-binding transcriptional ArsR family regulator